MLSNQTTILTPGRHQRQNSTPTAIDTHRFHHKRGLSLDQTGRTLYHHGLPNHVDSSIGVEHTLGQELTQTASVREAQQQQPMARPGLELETTYDTLRQILQLDALRAQQNVTRQERSTDFFNRSHNITPTERHDSLSQVMPRQERDNGSFANNLYTTSLTDLECDMHHSPQYIYESALKREPCTPPSQTRADYFPLTPSATPFSQHASIVKNRQIRTANSSPTRRDPNLTIKASHDMQRGLSYQDNFTALRQAAMTSDLPSPPNTAPLEVPRSVDLAVFPQPGSFNMSSLKMDIPLWDDGFNESKYSPMSNPVSSVASSFQSSPEMTNMTLFENLESDDVDGLLATNTINASESQSMNNLETCLRPSNSDSQPRSQSVTANDQINEGAEETGITNEEIHAFISQPDDDNKWTCLYPDCRKTFGRKENIKSHVQTHLDDRQFRCRDCNKRFVRQHDLKRHANIHSGVRSYPCPCGKLFARHDALTRHRQRGMCIGAFEGTPKKVIKRGRPRKARQDTELRLEKSAATRERALEKLIQRSPSKATPSISGSSVSSYPSPKQEFEEMDINAVSAILGYTPAGSPGYSIGNRTSNSGSRRSSISHSATLPELDISSSSPAAPRFLDFDGSSEANFSEPLTASLGHCQDFSFSMTPSKDELFSDVGNPGFNDFFDTGPQGTGYTSVLTGSFDNTLSGEVSWGSEI